MKFSCNNCNTRYSLPDEKFLGKVITLTCKKCGAKIVVKPEKSSVSADQALNKTSESKSLSQGSREIKKAIGLEEKREEISEEKRVEKEKRVEVHKKEEESKPLISETKKEENKTKPLSKDFEKGYKKQEEKSEKAKEEDKKEPIVDEEGSSGWYYSRGGEQRGPFSDEEIKELVENNVITPRTFVWREGMMDWMRAGICVEFKHFFGEEKKDEEKNNAIKALGLEEIDKKFRENKAEPEVEKKRDTLEEDFFAAEIKKEIETKEKETDWTKIPSEPDTSEPRENTRIVIMKAGLSESAKRKRALIRIITAAVLVGVFLFVFIKNLNPILSAVGVRIKTGVDLEMEDLDKDTVSKMTPEERERYRKALLGIKEPNKLSKEQKKRIAMTIKQRPDLDLAGVLENAKVDTSNTIYSELGRERLGPAGGPAPNLDIDTKLANLGLNTKIEGIDLSSKVVKKDIDLSGKLPDKVDTLNEDVIMMIVNRNRGSVKYCYERHLKASSSLEGKAVFKITIQNDGKVSRVDSLSRHIAGSLFEECIIKEIKKWTFPRFSGEPVTFEIPFVLTSVN